MPHRLSGAEICARQLGSTHSDGKRTSVRVVFESAEGEVLGPQSRRWQGRTKRAAVAICVGEELKRGELRREQDGGCFSLVLSKTLKNKNAAQTDISVLTCACESLNLATSV